MLVAISIFVGCSLGALIAWGSSVNRKKSNSINTVTANTKKSKLSFFSQYVYDRYMELPEEFRTIDIYQALVALDNDYDDWEVNKSHLDLFHNFDYKTIPNEFYCSYKNSICTVTGPKGHWGPIAHQVGALANAARERDKIMRDAANAGNMEALQETLTSLRSEAKIASDINTYLKEQ